MSPRVGRFLAFVLPALLLSWRASTLPAFAAPRPQDAQQNELAADSAGAQIKGEAFTGALGITETVDEIMARAGIPEMLERPVERRRRPPAKAENPLAPAVASWPPGPVQDAPGLTGPPLFLPQTPLANFQAVVASESGWVPPDPAGAIGPTQVLVVANNRIKVFDKTGALGPLNVSTDTFFASVAAGSQTTDGHVRYDRLSARWFVTIQSRECPDNRILIAVSSGPTITGATGFTFFSFLAEAGRRVDDSKLGVDRNALYIGTQMYVGCPRPGTYQNATAFVIRKSDLLAGTLTVTAFRNLQTGTPLSGIYAPAGVQDDDPASTEGYFVGTDRAVLGQLRILRVNNPGGTPTITGFTLTVPATAVPIDQVQTSGATTLDAVDDRTFNAEAHRNKITGALTLWTAHAIQVNASGVGSATGGRNGARWYEIGNLTTTPTLVQSGTLFDPAATNPFGYIMPAVAASGQGHMALGATRAGAAANGQPSVIAAGRLRTDAAGATQAATVVHQSTFSYNEGGGPPDRWGDSSQTSLDPTDDQTIWTFQEYAANGEWAVRAVQLRAPAPAAPATAAPQTVVTNRSSINVVITGTSALGTEFFDPGADTGGPGFLNRIASLVGGGVTVNSVTFNSPTQITLNISTVGTPVGLKDVTVTNPDGQAATGIGLINVVNCPAITVNPATIPAGTAGTAYSQVFTQTGGNAPVTFGLSGTLPTGMSFNAGTATLSGTPTQTGSFPITVTATDNLTCTGNRAYTLVVNCQTITVNPASVPAGTVGTAYSQAFTQTGGIGTITWTQTGTLPTGLTFNAATATLSGTPTQSGTFSVTVNARDANNCLGSRTYSLVINCQAITVNPAAIPAGTAGTAYSQVFTQTGGNGTITWSLTGTLPTGLTFNAATATLSGTPTQTGSFSVTVTATDANGCVGTRSYTLVINCQAITVNPATIPAGTAGTAYSQVFTQAGGIGTITWTLTGTLPTGLTFNAATATLSGTPTQTGSFSITVTATDANGCVGTRSYTLVINCQTITVNPATIPAGTAGTAYSQVFTQTSGIGTITWALTGTLPTGLTFNAATATLSGTPTQTGSFSVTVTATDANGCVGTRSYTLVINCQTITVNPATLPSGTAGTAYSQVFTQTSGIGSITWALTGTLPTGLTFNAATATLSGTPTQTGSFNVTVTATDANGCVGTRSYTLVINCQTITVNPATLPNGTAGSPYSQAFTQTSGIGTITWALTGTLPTGLTFNAATATLSGTPTQTGSFSITVTATDANGCVGTRSYTLVINCQTITVNPASIPDGTAGSAYSQTFTESGGIGTITWALTGTLPTGMSFNAATATLSGTPTQTGSFTITVTATDGNGCVGTRTYTFSINCQTITVNPATLPSGTAGTAYSQAFTQTSGIGTITWALTGTLPTGLTFNAATATLSGTPTQTGSFSVTVTATDANGCVGTRSYTLVINCQTITVNPATLPSGTAGTAYSQVFTQTSGIGSITWALTGTLPTGLTFNAATATLSGTPTQTGSFPITVTATDSNGCFGSRSYTLVIDCQTITVDPSTIPSGTAGSPYSQTFTQTGGIGTITFSLTGTLPTGLSFDTATGVLSGTPTQTGSFPITVTATDSNGCFGSRSYTLVIDCQTITVDPSTIPSGTAGSPYSQTFTESGGIGTTTFSLTGTLPTGLSFDTATGVLSGTPTQTGSFPITVTATDSNGCFGSRSYTLVIDCQTITVDPSTIPSGTAGSPYSQTFTESGGIGTITFSLTGTLPTGLSFDTVTGVLSGTPTQTGSFPITVTATDANGCFGSRSYTLVIDCQTITVNPASIPSGTAGSPYSQTFTQTGGIGTITFSLTGTLPTGLSFDTATGVLSGTPTQTGSFPITVTATDSNGCFGSRSYTLIIDCQTITVDPSTIPSGTAGSPYSQTFTESGGIGTITWSLTGTLPTGLSFDTATGVLSGTPTQTGSFPITVTATDSNGCFGSRSYTLIIDCQTITVDPSTIPSGTAGSPYSQTFTQTGGIGTITFSLTGTLPTGLSFDTVTGVLSGTPTQTGSFNITITATDANGCIGTRSYTLVINCQTLTVNPASIPSGTGGAVYSQTFTQTGGIGTITFSLTGTLPTGLSFDTVTGVLSGTPTQTGSFNITITATDANGCIGTRSYTLVINCQTLTVNPASIPAATAGSAYSQTFTQTSGIGTITWSLTGTLPTGLSFNTATGVLSGTPVQLGSFNITVTATDANGCAGSRAYTLAVNAAGPFVPTALLVDEAGNKVFEAGETAIVAPSWRNDTGAPQPLTGTASLFTGPGTSTYTISDSSADYGANVAAGGTANCASGTGNCYAFNVTVPATRPSLHWDSTYRETLSSGDAKTWKLHLGDSFTDVPRTLSPYYRFIETLLHKQVTGGCSPTTYCPSGSTLREQMAVFVLVAKEGPGYLPPACTTPIFADVPASSVYCRFIEELARRNVVAGCGGGNYCPAQAVTREQMSVFVLRTLDPTINPPACTTPLFADVPATSPFCRWIEELARRGVVSGCGGGNYCPTDPVTREQMGVFITVTFDLKLYGI